MITRHTASDESAVYLRTPCLVDCWCALRLLLDNQHGNIQEKKTRDQLDSAKVKIIGRQVKQ